MLEREIWFGGSLTEKETAGKQLISLFCSLNSTQPVNVIYHQHVMFLNLITKSCDQGN